MFCIDAIDLACLARDLEQRLGPELEVEYLDGRTLIRDAIVELLGCSALESEELVETLESRRYVRFPTLLDETHPNRVARWLFSVPAADR
jgi:hypothetical protein